MELIKNLDLQSVNLVSIFCRLALAVLCGGILGVERGRKKRPAGFRTYMLVCIGATLVMITNQYVYEVFGASDPARMGAQVISGIGFLGAGTIIVTGRNQVRGLTTAAGLWAAACMGLAIGIGFYSGAIMGCLFIFVVMTILHKLDSYIITHSKVIDFYAEFGAIADISSFLQFIHSKQMRAEDIHITKPKITETEGVAVMFTIKLQEKQSHAELVEVLSCATGVKYIEEI